MSSEFSVRHNAFGSFGDLAERRAEAERRRHERAVERQEQIALQSAPFSNPEVRIRQWEKVHALRLPQSATHKLVRVIAAQTDLSLQQILEVQQRRAAPAIEPAAAHSQDEENSRSDGSASRAPVQSPLDREDRGPERSRGELA